MNTKSRCVWFVVSGVTLSLLAVGIKAQSGARKTPLRPTPIAVVPPKTPIGTTRLVSRTPAPVALATTHDSSALVGLVALDDKGAVASQCPLLRTDVKADVVGTIARVTVTQKFRNSSMRPIEALYTFPLPQDSAVNAMQLRIGDRLIQGQIKRREEARHIYEAAKSAGQSAALLDQERPNIFTQRVANLMPGSDVNVEITFIQPVIYRAGHYEWTFPTVVGPRYTPTGGYNAVGARGAASKPESAAPKETKAVVTDADKITPPITPQGQSAGHDLTMSVRLESPVPLGAVSSALHSIDVARSGEDVALVSLKAGSAVPNRDFVLRWTPRDNAMQTGVVANADKTGGTFSLVLQPPTAPPREQVAPKEMVFVIDQTGSQSGEPIAKAKETMRYCIQNLNQGDTFQLLGFTTEVHPCFAKPVTATHANIQKALTYLKGIDADGGTDILKAADYTLKLPDDPKRPRIICFMTDGYVGNDMQVIDYIRKNRGHARMFPFGVGNSVNSFLIDGMAREGRGVAEYVHLNESAQATAKRFDNRIAKPLLLDVKVNWGGLPVADVYPKIIPDVFESAPIVLTGRYKNASASSGDVTVSGLLGGEPWSRKVRVELPANSQSGEGLPSLWARQRIEDLQSQDWMGAQSGTPNPNLKAQITNVALDFHLMSQYTSFVAVEQRVVNVGGQQQTIDVPVEMPDGVSYGGIFGEGERSESSFAPSGTAAQLNMPMSRMPMSRAKYVAPSSPAPYPQLRAGSAGASKGIAGPMLSSPVMSDASEDGIAPVSLPQLDTDAAQKRLDAMKPAERRTLLRNAKLAPDLQKKLNGKTAAAGTLTVQIWLNTLSESELKTLETQLKALGFELAATLRPNQLLLGTLPATQLDALIALRKVRFVELPQFKS